MGASTLCGRPARELFCGLEGFYITHYGSCMVLGYNIVLIAIQIVHEVCFNASVPLKEQVEPIVVHLMRYDQYLSCCVVGFALEQSSWFDWLL